MITKDKIADIIEKATSQPVRDMDESFKSQGYDSLDIIEIVMVIEKEFDMAIHDDIISKFKCPSDILKYLIKHL